MTKNHQVKAALHQTLQKMTHLRHPGEYTEQKQEAQGQVTQEQGTIQGSEITHKNLNHRKGQEKEVKEPKWEQAKQ